jgi:hypothetical protein
VKTTHFISQFYNELDRLKILKFHIIIKCKFFCKYKRSKFFSHKIKELLMLPSMINHFFQSNLMRVGVCSILLCSILSILLLRCVTCGNKNNQWFRLKISFLLPLHFLHNIDSTSSYRTHRRHPLRRRNTSVSPIQSLPNLLIHYNDFYSKGHNLILSKLFHYNFWKCLRSEENISFSLFQI